MGHFFVENVKNKLSVYQPLFAWFLFKKKPTNQPVGDFKGLQLDAFSP